MQATIQTKIDHGHVDEAATPATANDTETIAGIGVYDSASAEYEPACDAAENGCSSSCTRKNPQRAWLCERRIIQAFTPGPAIYKASVRDKGSTTKTNVLMNIDLQPVSFDR